MSVLSKEWYRNVYLRSDPWQLIRSAVLEKFRGICQICGIEDVGNDVHHIWYDDLRYADPKQFSLLCRRCHEAIHDIMPTQTAKTPIAQNKCYRAFNAARRIVEQSVIDKHGIRANVPKFEPKPIKPQKPKKIKNGCFCCKTISATIIEYDIVHGIIQFEGCLFCIDCIVLIQELVKGMDRNRGAQIWKKVKEFSKERSRKISFDIESKKANLESDSCDDVGLGF